MSYSKPRDSTARERVYDAIKYAKASSHKGLTVKDIADMENGWVEWHWKLRRWRNSATLGFCGWWDGGRRKFEKSA